VPSFVEFVAIIAALMGLTAFSIDNLLPAFASIAQGFQLSDPNQTQLIIIVFMASFSVMDLVYGPLSDRFGRKPILLAGLLIYALGTLLGALSTNLPMLLAARFLQGAGAASPRVLVMAIVRDRYTGREMARILSLAMMVFFIVPVLAPTVGTLLLMLGSWRFIFVNMLLFVTVLTIVVAFRLPETFTPVRGGPSIISQSLTSLSRVCTNKEAMANVTALSLMMGCLMTYLVSSPEIFETGIYNLGHGFPIVFAIIALCMAMAAFVNSTLVRRMGMHRLSYIGLIGFVLAAVVLLAEAWIFDGRPPLVLLVATLAVLHFLFSLTSPNLNAIAMEPLGDVAGMASSFFGFYSTLVSAFIGYVFGQAFNGTIMPLAFCYFTMGILSLVIVLNVRRGRISASQEPASRIES
jgi:MFS transporter, DHA1 family, multidrug resistance protein